MHLGLCHSPKPVPQVGFPMCCCPSWFAACVSPDQQKDQGLEAAGRVVRLSLHRNLRDFCAVMFSSHLSAGVAGKWPEGAAGKLRKFREERQKGGTLPPAPLSGRNQPAQACR